MAEIWLLSYNIIYNLFVEYLHLLYYILQTEDYGNDSIRGKFFLNWGNFHAYFTNFSKDS